MAKLRQYDIRINPILGLVEAPKKMSFFRSDSKTSTLKVLSTEELTIGTVLELTCVKRKSKSIVTMTGEVDSDQKTFTLELLSQFTSTSDTLDCELQITQDSNKITTFPSFSIAVNPSIVDGVEGGQDKEEETVLSNLIAQIQEALRNVGTGGSGQDGEDGRGIVSITKTNTVGLVDTYTILFTDNTTSTFTVTNGKDGDSGTCISIAGVELDESDGITDIYKIIMTDGSYETFEITNGQDGRGIVNITKTNTSGLVDTYTIRYTDNTTSTFTVTNGQNGTGGGESGKGIDRIEKTGTQDLLDTYTIYYTDNTTSTFTVTNGSNGNDGAKGNDGNGIVGIAKTGTSGLVDTYTITFTNGETFTYNVTNGQDGDSGSGSGGSGGSSIDMNDIAITGIVSNPNFVDSTKFDTLYRTVSSPTEAFPKSSDASRQIIKFVFDDINTVLNNYDNIYISFFDIANTYYNNFSGNSSGQKKSKRKLFIEMKLNPILDKGDGTYESYSSSARYVTMELFDVPKILAGGNIMKYCFTLQFSYNIANKMTNIILLPTECHMKVRADSVPYIVHPVSKTLLYTHKAYGNLNSLPCVGYAPSIIRLGLYNEDEEEAIPLAQLTNADVICKVRGEKR